MRVPVLLCVCIGFLTLEVFGANGVKMTIERKLDLPEDQYKLIKQENKNKEAAVGHWIRLRGTVYRDGVDVSGEVTAWQWDVEGEKLKAYVTTKALGKKTELTPPDFKNRHLDYYWVCGSGDKVIKLIATYKGEDIPGKDSIILKRPTPNSLEGTTTGASPGTKGVTIDNDFIVGNAEKFLHFGKPTGVPGIEWTGLSTAPVVNCPIPLDGRGVLATFQLINLDTKVTFPDDESISRTSGGKFVLDNDPQAQGDGPEYASLKEPIGSGASATITLADSPGGLVNGEMKSRAMSDKFKNYLMYRPDGANSIYVTLAKMDWFWGGTAKKNADGTFALEGADASQNPDGADTCELPEWDNFATNIQSK